MKLPVIIFCFSLLTLTIGSDEDHNKDTSSSSSKLNAEHVSSDGLAERSARQANMNAYMDYIMERFGPWIDEVGGGIIELPDMVEEFEVRYILITYSAVIYLWNGNMYNINKASRHGDSTMHYDRQLLRVRTSASFNSMNFRYDYQSIFMNIGGWTGYCLGDIDNMVFSADFLIDMWDFYIFMQDFHVVSIGNIDLVLRGNIFTDWIGNAMISVITTLFRTRITEYVSDVLRDFMQQAIDEMNERNFNQRVISVQDFIKFVLAENSNKEVVANNFFTNFQRTINN